MNAIKLMNHEIATGICHINSAVQSVAHLTQFSAARLQETSTASHSMLENVDGLSMTTAYLGSLVTQDNLHVYGCVAQCRGWPTATMLASKHSKYHHSNPLFSQVIMLRIKFACVQLAASVRKKPFSGTAATFRCLTTFLTSTAS